MLLKIQAVFRGIFFTLISLILINTINADGGLFSTLDNDLYEPNQVALLIYDEGKETIILQTNYNGNVKDFAWVIPVPSYPELESANVFLFRELSSLSQPQTDDFLFGKSGSLGEVVVHSKSIVGIYNTTILSGKDGQSIVEWLNDNSYFISAEASSILDEYAKNDWYFVAMKIDGQYEYDYDEQRFMLQTIQKERIESLVNLISHYVITNLSYNRMLDDNTEFFTSLTINTTTPCGVSFHISEKDYLTLHKEYFGYSLSDIQEKVEEWFISDEESQIRQESYNGYLEKYSSEFGQNFQDLYQIREYLVPRIAREMHERKSYNEIKFSKYIGEGVYNSRMYSLWNFIGDPNKIANQADTIIIRRMGNVYDDCYPYYQREGNNHYLHPLIIRFSSEKIIYPLKITSINKGEIEILLYVFAEYRTYAENFKVEYANYIPEETYNKRYNMIDIYRNGRYNHSDYFFLNQVIDKKYFLTKLRAEMNSSDIKDDVLILQYKNNEPYIKNNRDIMDYLLPPLILALGFLFIIAPIIFIGGIILIIFFIIKRRFLKK